MKLLRKLKWFMLPIAAIIILLIVYILSAKFIGTKKTIYFKSDITIEGLIIKPDTPGPHPAILLLHGSGGNHQGYNKLFFRFHSNAFVKKGFAVMVYNKRGSGNNDVDYSNFTYKQLMNDAHTALKFLRSRTDIDQNNIGIFGISESGWFTPELATLDGNIRFIINRVSSPFSFTQTVNHEVRMDATDEGFTEDEINNHILPLTQDIWEYYINVSKDPALAFGQQRKDINQRLFAANTDARIGKWFISDQLTPYDSLYYSSKGQNYSYDPYPFLNKIHVPMLYVMGGKDKNIPTSRIVRFLEEFKETNNKDITVKVYPKASHYLYKYGLEDGPYEGWLYVHGYLDHMTNWAFEQLK